MLSFIIGALALIIALTVHEFAHAWVADKLGDPTASLAGRVSLNPLKHLDPMGTLMLFLFKFGWGKPVPFDPFNLQHPKRDSALIALAGPASNLIMASILALVLPLITSNLLIEVIIYTIIINVNLAIFNIIPIPPLDGSKILYDLLPSDWADEYNSFIKDYGSILLILLIIPLGGSSLAIKLISPLISLIVNWLI